MDYYEAQILIDLTCGINLLAYLSIATCKGYRRQRGRPWWRYNSWVSFNKSLDFKPESLGFAVTQLLRVVVGTN